MTIRKDISQKLVDRGCVLLSVNGSSADVVCFCGKQFTQSVKHLKNLRNDPLSRGNQLSCGCISNRWTNERIDNMLSSRQCLFKRVTDITGMKQPSTTKIEWGCLRCSHVWKAAPDQINQARSGCPVCSGNTPYTVETLQDRLTRDGNNIKVLDLRKGTVKGGDRFATFECTLGHQWNALIHNVIKFGYGCPECNYNIGKPCYSKDGKRFHSKLERYAYEAFTLSDVEIQRQRKYTPSRRLTCDFFIPSLGMWVEVSGTTLLNMKKYRDAIDFKRSIVENEHKQRFVMLSSFAAIDQFTKEYL